MEHDGVANELGVLLVQVVVLLYHASRVTALVDAGVHSALHLDLRNSDGLLDLDEHGDLTCFWTGTYTKSLTYSVCDTSTYFPARPK
eukprot:1152693-Alexandrium_andersonii.AAC.1